MNRLSQLLCDTAESKDDDVLLRSINCQENVNIIL